MPWDDEHARRQVAQAEELLSGLETLPDSAAAARATEAVEALVDLYGDCLARVLEHLGRAGEGRGLARQLADDELIGHLLLVHDLHPDPMETRVRRALEEVRQVSALARRRCGAAGVVGHGGTGPAHGRRVRLLLLVRGPGPGRPGRRLRHRARGRAGRHRDQPADGAETLIPVDALVHGRPLTAGGAR